MFNYNILLRGYHPTFMLPVFLAGLFLAAPVQAAHIFSVNSVVDAADTSPGDGSCVAPIGGGTMGCTLRAAVQEANALITAATPDTNITIALPPGTFTLTGAANEDNAASGDLDILGTCPSTSINTPCLTINGNSAAGTIINGDFVDRVFHLVGRNTVKINNVTIQNGLANQESGGAIKNTNGWLTLENCTITSNKVGHAGIGGSYSGGGLFNGENAQMVVNNCTISANEVLNLNAQAVGAFIGGGGIFNSGIMTLNKTIVENNKGRPFGGGIQNSNGALTGTGKLALNESIVRGNTNTGSSSGGGISNHGGAVTLTRTIIRANSSLDGGGISNLAGAGQGSVNGSLRVISSVVDNNTGGGILNQGGADISYSTISGNKAAGNGASADGGGIYNRAPGDVVVTNSTITGNSAFRSGGGIFNGRTLTLSNVTLSGNSAEGSGEELFVSVDPDPVNAVKLKNAINNTIIGGNAAQLAGQLNCMSGHDSTTPTAITATAKMVSGGNNLENGDSCGLRGSGDLVNTSPSLDALVQSGSADETRLLDLTRPPVFVPLTGSAAIANGACTNKFDQRLFGRPGASGAACDIGAVETDGDPAVSKVDLEVNLTGSVSSVSLNNPVTYTLLVTNNGPGTAVGVTVTAQLPLGTNATFSVAGANSLGVLCTPSGSQVSCKPSSNLPSGANFTVFINVTPVSAVLNGTSMEIRARVDVGSGSPNDWRMGNNGSLDSCVTGACVVTAVVPPNNNFGSNDGGGGAFGPLELLLLGLPGALLLRRRKIRA